MKKVVFVFLSIIALLTISISVYAQKKAWTVPATDKSKANPVKADATSLAEGKQLWAKHCQSCHGRTGKGDGPKAAQLKTEPGDFTLATTQSQTDGSLFYKIAKGREDMPAFKKKMEPDEIWTIVNYIRTLKK